MVDSGEKVPLTQVQCEFDDRLLQAMETAVYRGGSLTAGRVHVAHGRA